MSAAFHTKGIDAPYNLLLQKPVPFDALLKKILHLLENPKS